MTTNLAQAVCTALLGASFLTLSTLPARATGPQTESVRLYALDCGRITSTDLSGFSDTGEYEGRGGTLAAPCFVVAHPKGVLLWDTGLGDVVAKNPDGIQIDSNTHIWVDATIGDQLAAIGLSEADVTHVAFSHLHQDHTGNANKFGAATWIMNKRELAWARSQEATGLVDLATISGYADAKKLEIDGDHDVFGDGSVRILRTPGHTPGHQVLLLKLARAGHVMLSGDLFHTKENEREWRVPVFNTHRAETLASFDRVKRILKNKRARLYVQHAQEDFAALPRFPHYLN